LASNAFTLPFSNVNLLSFGFESNFYALVKRRARTTSMFYMLPFRAKVKKYGDRVLATIEDFLSKHPNPRRNSSGSGSGSNEHTEAAKKRRGFTASYAGSNGEDDFELRRPLGSVQEAPGKDTEHEAGGIRRREHGPWRPLYGR